MKDDQTQQTGYAEPLFEVDKPRGNDDFAIDSSPSRYHDKQQVLDVAKGLCHDIFFRAEDVNDPDFKDIPDFAEPMDPLDVSGKRNHKKPLDTGKRNRTYALSPEEKTDEGRAPRPSRRGSKPRAGGKRRRRRRPPRGAKKR